MSARECIIPVFVPHLGCPNDCVFCNQRRISGHQQPVDALTLAQETESAAALLPKGAKRQLAFYGGSFTAIPKCQQEELLGCAKGYLERGLIDSIRLSTRPDAIDGEILNRLEHYGVETIELGAQSLDDEVLLLSGRGHTAQDVADASELIRQCGFKLVLQMMTGLPGDTEQKDIETAKKIIALRPDAVRIYPTVIVRDTALYDLWQAGLYEEHTVDKAVSVCAKLLPLFQEAGIPVIRLGLNPTEDLSGGDAAGGAYHPALGELVRSRIMLERARGLLAGAEAGSRVIIHVPRGKTSQMAGQHRANTNGLIEEFKLRSLRVMDDLSTDEMKIEIIDR